MQRPWHRTTLRPRIRRPVIACFGDSLTAGYGVDADGSYPANLQRDLDEGGLSLPRGERRHQR